MEIEKLKIPYIEQVIIFHGQVIALFCHFCSTNLMGSTTKIKSHHIIRLYSASYLLIATNNHLFNRDMHN